MNRIAKLRRDMKITKDQLAKDMGISVDYLTQIESGLVDFKSEILFYKLAGYFSVTIDYLLCRTDSPDKYSETNSALNPKVKKAIDILMSHPELMDEKEIKDIFKESKREHLKLL